MSKNANKKSLKHWNITNFLVCSRCRNPLETACFKEMDDEIFLELCQLNYINGVKAEKDDRNILLPIFNRKLQSSAMTKVMLPVNIPDISSDIMIVAELSSLPLENSQSLRFTDAVNNLVSDNPRLEHPLCEDCTDNILDQMDSLLKTVEDEHKKYEKFLKMYNNCDEDGLVEEFNKECVAFLRKGNDSDDEMLSKKYMEYVTYLYSDSDEDNLEELEKELSKLKATEIKLETELQECKKEQEIGGELLKVCEEEIEVLEKKDKQAWTEYSILKHKFLSLEDSKHSVNNQLMYVQTQLNKLAETSVFTATFRIWHDGHFGTVNNFRLGRLPMQPVEWTEINAAWGQTVLLLHCLANRINLTFQRYRLVPYGSHSYIVPLDNETNDLPLYCIGGDLFVMDHRFDDAMVAFLDCLQQLKEKIETSDNSYHLPYRIHKGKIEEIHKNSKNVYSVKIHLNSQEQWTKALKLMLTNLNWALAWVSNQFEKKANN